MSTPRDTPEARTLAEPADPKAQPREPGTVFEIEIDTDTLETRFQRFPLAAPPAASGARPTEIEIEQAMETVHDALNGEGAFEGLDLSARITMLRTVAHLLDAQPTDRLAGERAPAQPAPPLKRGELRPQKWDIDDEPTQPAREAEGLRERREYLASLPINEQPRCLECRAILDPQGHCLCPLDSQRPLWPGRVERLNAAALTAAAPAQTGAPGHELGDSQDSADP